MEATKRVALEEHAPKKVRKALEIFILTFSSRISDSLHPLAKFMADFRDVRYAGSSELGRASISPRRRSSGACDNNEVG